MLADFVSLAEKPAGLHLQIYPAVNDSLRAAAIASLGTSGLPCEAVRTVNDALEYLLRGFDETQGINLLQGDYAARSNYQLWLQPWRVALALLVVWLVLGAIAQGLELFRLKREMATLEATAQQALRSAFPRVTEITDVRTQAEQQLAALERAGGSQIGFLALLETTATVLGRNPKLELQELQYRDGALQMALEANDVEALDAFKQAFGDQPGFLLEVQSANVADKGVQIRATLRAAKS
jgi:general secretion pathway protein L